MTNQKMLKLYEKYGDCISFDLIFNLDDSGNKFGALVGINFNGSILLLGICMLRSSTKENYITLLKMIDKVCYLP
jgi:hypothetical protein